MTRKKFLTKKTKNKMQRFHLCSVKKNAPYFCPIRVSNRLFSRFDRYLTALTGTIKKVQCIAYFWKAKYFQIIMNEVTSMKEAKAINAAT